MWRVIPLADSPREQPDGKPQCSEEDQERIPEKTSGGYAVPSEKWDWFEDLDRGSGSPDLPRE